MSKIHWPKLSELSGIAISVSPHVPDDKIVLIGKERFIDALHFTRQLSILDLKTGKVSGRVHRGEVQRIEVSEKNKNLFETTYEEAN